MEEEAGKQAGAHESSEQRGVSSIVAHEDRRGVFMEREMQAQAQAAACGVAALAWAVTSPGANSRLGSR